MILLGVDTGSWAGSLALLRDGRVVAEWNLESQGTHSERLLPGLDMLLRGSGTRVEDLDAIAVTRGPGSFTGLRVGIATAKTLAFSAGLPLFGISSLEAAALGTECEDAPVIPVLDARRGSVFVQAFRVRLGRAEPIAGPLLEPVEVSPGELGPRIPPGAVLAGDGSETHRARIEEGGCPPVRWHPGPLYLAAHAARAAQRRLESGNRPLPGALEALYVRPADAAMGRGSFHPIRPA